ncbi:hypothetical protein P3471_24375, partial [Vibrio parahaemolyticus]|nr:hypothetical protein [Vibrio parahaemolyticus]
VFYKNNEIRVYYFEQPFQILRYQSLFFVISLSFQTKIKFDLRLKTQKSHYARGIKFKNHAKIITGFLFLFNFSDS